MVPSKRFRINTPKVIHETIDGEAVIINLDTGCYYSLDQGGADIWCHIEKSASVGEIAEDLIRRHNSKPAEIENAVLRFITELQNENLIVANSAQKVEQSGGPDPSVGRNSVSERPHFQAPTLQKYTDMQELLLLDPIHEVDETGWPSKPG